MIGEWVFSSLWCCWGASWFDYNWISLFNPIETKDVDSVLC